MSGPYYPQGALTLRVLWEDFGNKGNAKLQEVYTLPVLARRLSVNINDYTQADTFSCEIDYKQFPFDPRSIRACGVTISMQDMKRLFYSGRNPLEIKPTQDNTIFQGFADEESIRFDETARTVKLEGRDFTALLIDRPWLEEPPDLSRPLNIILEQILSNLKETASIELKNLVKGDLPTLGKYANSFSEQSQKKSGKKSESYWDVIQDLVSRAGLIGYIELDKLVISKPRVLYDEKKALSFVYGRNLKNLDFKRKLGRRKNFNVHVLSLNPESKTEPVINAYIPEEATAEWAKEMGLKAERIKIPKLDAQGNKTDDQDAPFITFRVPNIVDKGHLINVGQELYEELGRQQIEGSFSTRDMETHDGLKDCVNLLSLRNGTPLKIVIDQGDMAGLAKQSTTEQKTKFLIDRCYSPKVARALAETLTNPRFTQPFYTKGVEFTLDSENGFEIKVEFINFISVPEKLGGG
jgi:hypothetical protein